MTLIVAARFTTFDAANHAAQRLMEAGVHEEALHVFYVNPPGAHDRYPTGGDLGADPHAQGAPRKSLGAAALLGAAGAIVGGVIVTTFVDSVIPIVAGAGVGAYVGSLIGAMRGIDKGRDNVQQTHGAPEKREGRPAGVLLAVNAAGERAGEIAAVLEAAGGKQVERANGRWQGGKWVDFDPLQPPVPQAADPTP